MNRVISFALPVEADAAEAPCPPTWSAAIAAERSPPAPAAAPATVPARLDALLAGLTSLLVNLPPQQT